MGAGPSTNLYSIGDRGGTIPEITMRYVSRYAIRIAILESRYDTYHDTSLMLRLIDYQAKIKET